MSIRPPTDPLPSLPQRPRIPRVRPRVRLAVPSVLVRVLLGGVMWGALLWFVLA